MISASDVKSLREKTGAGMMDCKKALSETSGDMEAAVDFLRAKGLAQAAKKALRVAAEGAIGVRCEGKKAVLVEVNCETDFVSKGDDFQGFVAHVLDRATGLGLSREGAEKLKNLTHEAATELTLKCGEKVDVRRCHGMELKGNGLIGHYNHSGKIGVLVEVATDSDVVGDATAQELVKDLAMHVAAADPRFIHGGEIDEDFKKREADIYTVQLREQGKSEDMIPKIVVGKLNKLAKEVCLLEQKFVKNPDISVQKHIDEQMKKIGTHAKVLSMIKFNLGEGIEKRQDNLAEEVAKMTSGS